MSLEEHPQGDFMNIEEYKKNHNWWEMYSMRTALGAYFLVTGFCLFSLNVWSRKSVRIILIVPFMLILCIKAVHYFMTQGNPNFLSHVF